MDNLQGFEDQEDYSEFQNIMNETLLTEEERLEIQESIHSQKESPEVSLSSVEKKKLRVNHLCLWGTHFKKGKFIREAKAVKGNSSGTSELSKKNNEQKCKSNIRLAQCKYCLETIQGQAITMANHLLRCTGTTSMLEVRQYAKYFKDERLARKKRKIDRSPSSVGRRSLNTGLAKESKIGTDSNAEEIEISKERSTPSVVVPSPYYDSGELRENFDDNTFDIARGDRYEDAAAEVRIAVKDRVRECLHEENDELLQKHKEDVDYKHEVAGLLRKCNATLLDCKSMLTTLCKMSNATFVLPESETPVPAMTTSLRLNLLRDCDQYLQKTPISLKKLTT